MSHHEKRPDNRIQKGKGKDAKVAAWHDQVTDRYYPQGSPCLANTGNPPTTILGPMLGRVPMELKWVSESECVGDDAPPPGVYYD